MDNELMHRNTFICAHYDVEDRLIGFEKRVYGAVEMAHAYSYHASGQLRSACISMLDEDPVVLDF